MNVQGARGEQLQNNQIFGGTGPDVGAWGDGKRRGVADQSLFERKGAERDVNTHAAWRLKQKDAIAPDKIRGILHSCRVSGKKRIQEFAFAPKSGQQGKIDIASHARLTPSLDGDSADETRAPPLFIAERLQVLWQSQKDRSSRKLREPRLHLNQSRRRTKGQFPNGLIERAFEQCQHFQIVGFPDLLAANSVEYRPGFFPSLDPAAYRFAFFHNPIVPQYGCRQPKTAAGSRIAAAASCTFAWVLADRSNAARYGDRGPVDAMVGHPLALTGKCEPSIRTAPLVIQAAVLPGFGRTGQEAGPTTAGLDYFFVVCGNPGSFNFKSQPQSSPAFLAVF
jgi:hypothetical protein